MFVCLFVFSHCCDDSEKLADLCARWRWFPSLAPRALLAMLFPSSLGNALFPPAATLLKDRQTLPQSASRCNATLMYLYCCNVFWPKTVGKVRFSEETKSINFCVVTFVLAFCSMGQTVSSVKVGQDQRSLKYKGVGVKPTSFHLPSFPFSFSDTQKQRCQETLVS